MIHSIWDQIKTVYLMLGSDQRGGGGGTRGYMAAFPGISRHRRVASSSQLITPRKDSMYADRMALSKNRRGSHINLASSSFSFFLSYLPYKSWVLRILATGYYPSSFHQRRPRMTKARKRATLYQVPWSQHFSFCGGSVTVCWIPWTNTFKMSWESVSKASLDAQ